MKLTLQNYFTPENKYLTNSRISDYLRSPNYFYRKHILHEIEQKTTKAMTTGTAVDFLLAQNDAKPVFKIVERKNIKNPPTDCIEVNNSEYEEIMSIANAVSETDAFKYLDSKFEKQTLLKIDEPVGELFQGCAGLPDYIYHDDKEIIIADLKTSLTTDTRKYYYHAREYNYFNQAAFYGMLATATYGDLPITYYHLVVDKIKDIYNVVLFELDQHEIDMAKMDLRYTIAEISERTDWSRPNLTWKDAIKLRDPRTEYFDEDDN